LYSVAYALILFAVLITAYTYVGYPALLAAIAALRRPRPRRADLTLAKAWPQISITVPVYNERGQIEGLLQSLLAIDYPRDRLQIVIVSDASDDGTDDVVRAHAAEGIELLRMPRRGGKTVAENAASAILRGEIVINTDASIRIHPAAVRRLVERFTDPSVGVASGRDVSVGASQADGNVGEAGYVGYEMWIRSLETRVDGIIGSSGCFYAIRTHLHRVPLPDSLSRDFASALIARDHGYRAVSVDDAICYVPRTPSPQREYRRKVRTITRGIETLWHLRRLLNPVRHGTFAWMLWSHKVCRWLVPWAAAAAGLSLVMLAPTQLWAAVLVALVAASAVPAGIGWWRDGRREMPRWLAVPTFAWSGNIAAMHAGVRAMAGDQNPTWEPTRREGITVPAR
jgi:cellulose synthase/poly-beta-1,6-N-acetylglucosamine synthase-like glycosyltransferase